MASAYSEDRFISQNDYPITFFLRDNFVLSFTIVQAYAFIKGAATEIYVYVSS